MKDDESITEPHPDTYYSRIPTDEEIQQQTQYYNAVREKWKQQDVALKNSFNALDNFVEACQYQSIFKTIYEKTGFLHNKVLICEQAKQEVVRCQAEFDNSLKK